MKVSLGTQIVFLCCLVPITLLKAMDDFENYMPQCDESALKHIQSLYTANPYPYDMANRALSIDNLISEGQRLENSHSELSLCCFLHAYFLRNKTDASRADSVQYTTIWDHIQHLIKDLQTPKVEAIIAAAIIAGLAPEGLEILGIHYWSHGNFLKAQAAWARAKTAVSFDWLIKTSKEPEKSYYYLAKARQGCLEAYSLFAQEQELLCALEKRLLENGIHAQEYAKNEMLHARYIHLTQILAQETELLSFFNQLKNPTGLI